MTENHLLSFYTMVVVVSRRLKSTYDESSSNSVQILNTKVQVLRTQVQVPKTQVPVQILKSQVPTEIKVPIA